MNGNGLLDLVDYAAILVVATNLDSPVIPHSMIDWPRQRRKRTVQMLRPEPFEKRIEQFLSLEIRCVIPFSISLFAYLCIWR